MIPRFSLALALALLPCAAHALDDFRPLLADAVQRGDREVTIPAGIYRLKPVAGSAAHVLIKDAADLTIHADGVRLICEDLTRAVTFLHCRNVTLEGLTVDYDPLPFTQGKIVAIAPDADSIDIKLDAGYPRKPYSRIDLVDPATRFRMRGMPFLWNTRAEMVGDDVVRVFLKDIGKVAKIGYLASLSTGPRPGGQAHAVGIEDCEKMTFDRVSVLAAPGFGIIEQDGEGGMHYVGCKVVPGPIPAGATEERLLSSSWDAMQSKTMKRGPLVERCEIREAGDDSWSIQSSDYLVVSVDGSKATLAFRDEYCLGPQVGDRLTPSLNAKPVTITARHSVPLPPEILAKIKEAKPWSLWHTGNKAVEVTVDGNFPYQVGDSVYCPDRQGGGFVFRDNTLHSSGRILIKASDGLIANNRVVDGHSGVTVCPEVPNESAAGIQNLEIRGNTFIGTGYFCPSADSYQAGCISIATGSKKTTFENIRITDNHFEDINGAIIVLFSTHGVTIADNTFCRVMGVTPNPTGQSFGVNGKAVVWMKDTSAVTVRDNTVYEPGPFLKTTADSPDLPAVELQKIKNGITLSQSSCPEARK